MSAKEQLFESAVNIAQKRENIIHRIMNLSCEQFDQLITLYSQQEKEFCPADLTQRRTSA